MLARSEVLSPEQLTGAEWLYEREGSYLADPPGFGKTRQLLAACEDERRVTIVCPAAIRDAKVWEREAKLIGFDVPMHVMSYHQLANPKNRVLPGGALIFDEAHRLKSRDVSWSKNAQDGAAVSTRTHLASGTPTPNGYLPELYGQMRLINPEVPAAYWNNTVGNAFIERWFFRGSDEYTEYWVPGVLLGCVYAGCTSHYAAKSGRTCVCPCCVAGDCAHRQEFWAANVGDLMLRRPEELLDLPDLSGFNEPLDTPMTSEQKRVYADLKKDFLASLPEEGVDFEAMTTSQKFVMLMQASTGLSSVSPDNPDLDKHSGKRNLLAELLPDRSHPTVLGVYFRNTAAAMARMCDDLGLRYAMYGASTPKKDQVVEAFQRGDFDVLVASIMVVREGITLTAADQVALVERSWVPGDNEQTVRRVRRRGQTKSVTARQLVTPRSVDALGQWKALQSKTQNIRRDMSRVEIAAMLG